MLTQRVWRKVVSPTQKSSSSLGVQSGSFSDRPVKQEIVKRAVSLALKTPSVCNRQAWFVYHIDDQSIIGRCLELQNGNSGFGHKIQSLLIIASDLKAFDTGGERYQHWIDGGMFSMSLVYALHPWGSRLVV